ncbi:MAG TPA: 4Fe-4S binding protein [Bacteroidales bacterium]|nr:4Fe-4S binding protein [Bacteroidales bacterium]HPS72898.1 4Fe-4S binding protein [Bacteroidales bacterium]
MKRKIIQIDEEKCNGCGACVPNCQEGALQIIDGKARLISDLFCDGLGACIGHCPEGAIEIIEREAEPYDERKVMETLVPKGRNTILAHLEHLRDHGEEELLKQAIGYLKENNIDMGPAQEAKAPRSCGCPGGREIDFRESNRQEAGSGKAAADGMSAPSELRQWPVQLHLLNPNAAYFKDADVVLAADCVAFAMGNFHARFLKGKSIAIACPKLDSDKESYVEKLSMMISGAHINTLHVIMMEVPCCGGLLQMALEARQKAGRNIPIKKTIVSLQGEVLQEDWV